MNVKMMQQKGADPLYGVIIYLITIVGIYASSLKGYTLAQQKNRQLKWYGQLFIVGLYLVSLMGTIFLFSIAHNLIFEDFGRKDGLFLMVLCILYSFILLVLEGFYLENPFRENLPRWKSYLAEYGSMMYSSIGISICWDTFIIGGSITFQPGFSSVLQLVLLMLLIAFPFQRLFWYEALTDAESNPDKLKVLGGIILVLISGILPLYFVDRGY
jgi:hypothetical protein